MSASSGIALWLVSAEIYVAIRNHSQTNYLTGKEEYLRYQETADQTGFPIICIKGLPEANRYSVRLFAPSDSLRGELRYPKLYWATFALGEGEQLCLTEGQQFMYLAKDCQAKRRPDRDSELIVKAFNYANNC